MRHPGSSVPRILAIAAIPAILAAMAAQQSPPVERDAVAIAVESASVPLNPQDASQTAVGDFQYAGGVELEARDTDQLHGISDLEIAGTDGLVAVTDFGALIDARLVFDAANRLVGVTTARVMSLRDENGTRPSDKADADAEGFALLPGGDRLVSFERRHRILLYPASGDAPRRVAAPEEAFSAFPPNGGMEALAADPDAGADAYLVGAEVSGHTWSCHLTTSCVESATVEMPAGFGLVALRRLPGSQTAYLLRAFDERLGSRVSLQIVGAGKIASQMDLAAPLTVDNYEGLAVVPRPDGGLRFYLISDDNASGRQRTLLVAFDWHQR